MSILSRLLKRDPDAQTPTAVDHRGVERFSGSAPPLPAWPPALADRAPVVPAPAMTLGALPSGEYPLYAEDTRPYTWNGPSPRPSAGAAVVGAEPAISAAAVDEAFRRLVAAAESNLARGSRTVAGVSTATDRAALKETFEDLAFVHVAPLRNLILEVRWGEAQLAWIDLVRPVLRSLRAMAVQIELLDLVAGLDRFSAALDAANRAGGNPVGGKIRDDLIDAYQPLARSLPRAFTIEGERDRREPLIVESLLQQVPDMDPLLLARLSALGLARLDTLLRASAQEIADVAGVPLAVAQAVVQKVEDFQRCAPAIVGTDAGLARRSLEPLLGRLEVQHRCFEQAASGWSEDDLTAKRRARREREVAYQALRGALARMGEVDLVLVIEKLPFSRRLEEISRFVRQPAGLRPPPVPNPGGTADGRANP